MVISCSSSENRSEKWKNYLEKIFHQLQNEEQTEDQLEIEGFLNEWTRQRRWLLSNVRFVLLLVRRTSFRFVLKVEQFDENCR